MAEINPNVVGSVNPGSVEIEEGDRPGQTELPVENLGIDGGDSFQSGKQPSAAAIDNTNLGMWDPSLDGVAQEYEDESDLGESTDIHSIEDVESYLEAARTNINALYQGRYMREPITDAQAQAARADGSPMMLGVERLGLARDALSLVEEDPENRERINEAHLEILRLALVAQAHGIETGIEVPQDSWEAVVSYTNREWWQLDAIGIESIPRVSRAQHITVVRYMTESLRGQIESDYEQGRYSEVFLAYELYISLQRAASAGLDFGDMKQLFVAEPKLKEERNQRAGRVLSEALAVEQTFNHLQQAQSALEGNRVTEAEYHLFEARQILKQLPDAEYFEVGQRVLELNAELLRHLLSTGYETDLYAEEGGLWNQAQRREILEELSMKENGYSILELESRFDPQGDLSITDLRANDVLSRSTGHWNFHDQPSLGLYFELLDHEMKLISIKERGPLSSFQFDPREYPLNSETLFEASRIAAEEYGDRPNALFLLAQASERRAYEIYSQAEGDFRFEDACRALTYADQAETLYRDLGYPDRSREMNRLVVSIIKDPLVYRELLSWNRSTADALGIPRVGSTTFISVERATEVNRLAGRYSAVTGYSLGTYEDASEATTILNRLNPYLDGVDLVDIDPRQQDLSADFRNFLKESGWMDGAAYIPENLKKMQTYLRETYPDLEWDDLTKKLRQSQLTAEQEAIVLLHVARTYGEQDRMEGDVYRVDTDALRADFRLYGEFLTREARAAETRSEAIYYEARSRNATRSEELDPFLRGLESDGVHLRGKGR